MSKKKTFTLLILIFSVLALLLRDRDNQKSEIYYFLEILDFKEDAKVDPYSQGRYVLWINEETNEWELQTSFGTNIGAWDQPESQNCSYVKPCSSAKGNKITSGNVYTIQQVFLDEVINKVTFWIETPWEAESSIEFHGSRWIKSGRSACTNSPNCILPNGDKKDDGIIVELILIRDNSVP
jgi:hypothetical protein